MQSVTAVALTTHRGTDVEETLRGPSIEPNQAHDGSPKTSNSKDRKENKEKVE